MASETEAIHELIHKLRERAGQSSKLGKVRERENEVWGIPGLKISSWKFNDWDYQNPKAKLPSHARGLFTLGEDRILLRGYNKFFNMNELKTTSPEYLASNTRGPYAATVKENGCIVLITGFNGKLVVTSKHSSGPSQSVGFRNHSQRGRERVLSHLSSVGRTEEQLAKVLEERNMTAVGELCDDEFEEHVLAYPPSSAGIYLNGLNHNVVEFNTEPPAVVNAFGAEWGFLRTDFLEFEDFGSLHAFLLSCAETGKWRDREIEGFVIRCRLEDRDYFFKYKFEEPYLMYRQWREATQVFLKDGINAAVSFARRGRHSESTLKYLSFAAPYLEKNPEYQAKILFENVGIIELRQKFMERGNISEQDLLVMSAASDPRWILVPVATIGCGKTSVSRVLMALFGNEWAHRQNDNIVKKKGRSKQFTKLLGSDLSSHRVVIADRNNAQRSERKDIIDEISSAAGAYGFDVKFVCLNFLPEGVTSETRQITRDLVIQRGDRHQNIKSTQDRAAVNGIMSGFEHRFETVSSIAPDDQFDLVVDLEPGKTAANTRRVIAELRSKYADLVVPAFSDADIDAAVKSVLTEEADESDSSAMQRGNSIEANIATPLYFAVAIDENHRETLVRLAHGLVPADIMANVNVYSEFHVTLAHGRTHEKAFKKMFKKYKQQLHVAAGNPTVALNETQSVRITRVSWHKTAVAFKVETPGSANRHAHITVGTASNVPAVVSNYLFDGTALGTVELREAIVLEKQAVTAYMQQTSRSLE